MCRLQTLMQHVRRLSIYINWEQRKASFFCRANINWFDELESGFTKYWFFENGAWVKTSQVIQPDAVIDKTDGADNIINLNAKYKIAQAATLLNDPLFSVNLNNKLTQHMIFGRLMPKSYLANSQNDLHYFIDKIKGSRVVLKPLHGSGGSNIFIGLKEDVDASQNNFPILVQEFVEVNGGVPGLHQGKVVSDLRLVCIDGAVVWAMSRVAKNGSLFTNFHQGASAQIVNYKDVNYDFSEILAFIQDSFESFKHSFYSLDFIFT